MRPAPPLPALVGVLLVCLVLAACGDAASSSGASSATESADVRYAEGFSIERRAGYQLLHVRPPGSEGDGQTYALVPRGTRPDGVPEGAIRVETPVRSLVVYSTTHLGPLLALGLEDRLVGVPDTAWVHSPEVRRLARDGRVRSVGEAPDREVLAALAPDAVLVSGSGGEAELIDAFRALGIPIVVGADWLETTPLGRAEWMVAIGALFGEAEAAADTFAAVAERYERLAAAAEAVPERPAVLVGAPWRGTWFVPGGGSYMARLLADAGADYPWAGDPSTGALPLDFEAVYARAHDADVWLNPGDFGSLNALQAVHERVGLFEAWQQGRVFNNDRQRTAGGGFAYWERGAVEPDVLLADLLRILHPAHAPDGPPVYFRRLPTRPTGPASAPAS